jgi:hypothetical protein
MPSLQPRSAPILATLALVGGATAGGVLQKLFESKDANVRAAAAETKR